MTPYGWEGNRQSCVALYMRHRLSGLSSNWLKSSMGDKHLDASLGVRHPLRFCLFPDMVYFCVDYDIKLYLNQSAIIQEQEIAVQSGAGLALRS